MNFNASNSTTGLNWTGSLIEDVNHTLHIWRSPAIITDLLADEVEQIALLPANSTHFNFTVLPGHSGDSYYLITLSDELGNQQQNLSAAPNAHDAMNSLWSENQNIVTDLAATHSMGITQLTWSDLENHYRSSVPDLALDDRPNCYDL